MLKKVDFADEDSFANKQIIGSADFSSSERRLGAASDRVLLDGMTILSTMMRKIALLSCSQMWGEATRLSGGNRSLRRAGASVGMALARWFVRACEITE